MLKRHAILGAAAAAAIALLPMAPAMANGRGFRPFHPFGVGRGLLGAAVALATLPLVIASDVVAGVTESAAPYPSSGYAAPRVVYGARGYYAPRNYYAPRSYYAPRGDYARRPSYDGRGYHRWGGHTYPHR
jgi:hypothetical protein